MPFQRLLLLPLLLAGAAEAQVLTFDGDGFEACPRGAMTASIASWANLFAPFPQVSANNRISVQSGSSLGLLLVAPGAMMDGQLSAQVQAPPTGEAVLSLSPCAAVFPPNPASCVSTVSATPSIQWTTNLVGSGCVLQPGVAYYLNITFGAQTAPGNGQPWCSGAACGVTLLSTAR